MHSESMSTSEGTFGQPVLTDQNCPRCGAPMNLVLWTSSCGGYEDELYCCTKCNHQRWVDGIDS